MAREDEVRYLDVSGAFDNCLFHALAVTLLAKNSLPDDLFTFQSILGQDSTASKLQKYFPNQRALKLFAFYAYKTKNPKYKLTPNFYFEQILILGFLLREWCATHAYELLTIHEELSRNKIQALQYGMSVLRDCPNVLESMCLDSHGVLYSSSREFLERTLTGEPTTQEECYINYWHAEGKKNTVRVLVKKILK